jgi:hypothetical protein
VNCTAVRDRLAEHALAALPPRDATPVDRHLAWCAACRKEAGELQQASATLAFTLAPEDLPADLEDRVVGAVRSEVARRVHRPQQTPRRSRLVLVASLTAMLAVVGTGWGAVMAGRAARSDDAARIAKEQRYSAVERFRAMLNTLEFGDNEGEVFIGPLEPVTIGGGSGNAFSLVSPSMTDMVFVLIDDVPTESRELLPFAVRLRSDDGVLMVDRLEKLDDSGAGTVTAEFLDLTGYDTVVVRDADGHVVMSGTMRTRAIVASSTPAP